MVKISRLCMWNTFCTFAGVNTIDMKIKLFIATILCAFGVEAFAQAQYNPYAVEKTPMGGLGFQIGFARDLLRERKGDNESKKFPYITNLNGFKVGAVYDATIIKGFAVSMALNYTIAGAQDKWQTENSSFTGKKVRNSYLFQSLDIPIDWQYKFEIAKETYLILYTGPTIQYNFYFQQKQQHKIDIPGQAQEWTDKINHYDIDADADDKQDYSELNLTWGIGAGFQYQRYFLRGGYDFGIYNPYKDRYFNMGNGGYYNRGRLDQWSLKVGMYLWEF